jgi:hypothetical protein
MQPLGLSVPLTTAQRPFIFWVGGRDILQATDYPTWTLDDKDLTQPGVFTFSVTDYNNTVGKYIQKLDEVIWVQTNPEKILWRGFVRQIDVQVVATYGIWKFTCTDVSEIMDYAKPIISDARPAETTRKRVQHFLGNYGTASSLSTGGFISNFSGTVQPATPFQRETLRTAVEKSIAFETTGTNTAAYYMDYYYQVHVFSGLGDTAAPFSLTDQPVGGDGINYGPMTVTYDGTSDADTVYIYGNNAAGSGYVSTGIPRWPQRITSVDSSTSTTAATAQVAGLAELSRRQNITRVSLTVQGYDGWAKGQTVYISNVLLGWSSVQCWIMGVSMRVLSGTGYRQYTLQLNAMKPRLSRLVLRRAIGGLPLPVGAQSLQGQIGG